MCLQWREEGDEIEAEDGGGEAGSLQKEARSRSFPGASGGTAWLML